MIYQPTPQEREDDAEVGLRVFEDYEECGITLELLGHIIREYDRHLHESILTLTAAARR
jgi:hypothetical protein